MNDIDVFRLISGVLQLGVAWYVLRLGRLFKSTFTGWLVFYGLIIMALLNLVPAVIPLGLGAQWGIQVGLLYTMLLFVGLARFYSGLHSFLRQDATERRALDDWELQVKEQWVELNKVNERLRETISKRETEITERKQGQEQLEKRIKELKASTQHLGATLRRLEEEARQRERALPPPEPVTPPTAPPVEPLVPPAAPPTPAVEPTLPPTGQTTTLPEPAAPAVASTTPAVEPPPPTAGPAVASTPQSEPAIEPAAPSVELTEFPGVPELDTEVVAPPPEMEVEPVEANGVNGENGENGEHLETVQFTNGHEPLPVVAGFDTAILPSDPIPAPEPPRKNGEYRLAASHKNGEGSRRSTFARSRKVAGRKTRQPSRASRSNSASRPGRSSRSSQSSRRKHAVAR
jgi:hypothetical protein